MSAVIANPSDANSSGLFPGAQPGVAGVNASFVGSAPQAVPAPSTAAPTSLYVGDLDESVAESNLFELFSMAGPISSIRVCRDSVTRRSLKYAYVNYHLLADAQRAIETLNHTEIHGKPCRVMLSQRDPSFRKDKTGNVFIKNLDASIDNKALHDTFSAFGKVISSKVATENGVSKGFGFVHFEKFEEAENAIKNVNGMLLNDKKVYVAHYESASERQSKTDKALSTFTNIYVKGLSPQVTSEELREAFTPYGSITSCLVEVDAEGKSKLFGFVNFEAHDQAVAAINALHDKEFKGSKLYVARAQTKKERNSEILSHFQAIKEEKIAKSEGANLYFKNICTNLSDDEIHAAFASRGKITSFALKKDDNNRRLGFGFVCYETAAEAAKAINEMHSKPLGSKALYLNYAQRKEQRASQLIAQHNAVNHMPGMPNVMYSQGVFYPPGPHASPVPQGMMYGQPPMMPRPRWMDGQHFLQGQYMPNTNGNDPNYMPPQANRGPRQPRHNQSHRNNQRSGNNSHSGPRSNNHPAPEPVAAPEPTSTSGLSAAALAAASPEDQKQMLGEHLFPLISAVNEENAGKITGMLLEMDNDELLHLIENEDALKKKVNEALNILMLHVGDVKSSH